MPFFTRRDGTRLCFEQDGARTDLPVVLIHGIGCQLIQWPRSLVDGLVDCGLRVIRLDNRDAGLSSSFDQLGTPDVARLIAGEAVEPPYTLRDMAADTMALLDHLGQAGAHLVGVSLGGMIAQNAAIHFPDRSFSLTSIMSNSGHPDLPAGDPRASAMMTAAPTDTSREGIVQHMRAVWDVLGGPHYRSSEVGIGRLAAETLARASNPAGFARQLAAARADVHRWQHLGEIKAPTLVIHGDADPLVPMAASRDIAERVPNARIEIIEGMGHDLPEPVVPRLVELIDQHVHAAPIRR